MTNSALYTAVNWAAVTPSDSANITPPNPRALFVGTAGNVAVVNKDGVATTFKNVASGQVLDVQAVRVNSTNTTASDIVALY
jgi:hypothetical protein